MSLLEENSDPFGRGEFPHEERMSAVSLITWRHSQIKLVVLIVVPHRVNTVGVEQGFLGTFSKTHYSLVRISLTLSKSTHANPVKIRIVKNFVNLKVNRSLSLLLSELNHERILLNDDVSANLVAISATSRCVNDCLRYIEVLSLSFGSTVRPCPPDIHDTLVKHPDSHVEIGQSQILVHDSEACLRFGKGLREKGCVVKDWIELVLEVGLVAKVQVFVL